MACPAVTTGPQFLVTALAHLDCQAQTLGSFGFQALAQPGSVASVVLTGLLTLFIAIYGIRLLFGPGDEPRDLVNAVLKVGIVLTLAVSWPAWRVVAYDTVLYGPSEVAGDPARGLPSGPHTRELRLTAVQRARMFGEEPGFGYVLDEDSAGAPGSIPARSIASATDAVAVES